MNLAELAARISSEEARENFIAFMLAGDEKEDSEEKEGEDPEADEIEQ